jgi:hypothetical protein
MTRVADMPRGKIGDGLRERDEGRGMRGSFVRPLPQLLNHLPAQDLVHLEHINLCGLEDLLQFFVATDHPLIALLLQVMILDVLP